MLTVLGIVITISNLILRGRRLTGSGFGGHFTRIEDTGMLAVLASHSY
jgi:hypothetical protein